MLSKLSKFLVVLVVLSAGLHGIYGSDTTRGTGAHRPLDIPVETNSKSEEEEDLPETILFWGSEYEADSFFFCFPAFDF